MKTKTGKDQTYTPVSVSNAQAANAGVVAFFFCLLSIIPVPVGCGLMVGCSLFFRREVKSSQVKFLYLV